MTQVNGNQNNNNNNNNLKLHQQENNRAASLGPAECASARPSATMRKALSKLRDKKLSIVRQFQRESGLADYAAAAATAADPSSGGGRRKGRGESTASSGSSSSSSSLSENWAADMEYSERQNSVRTLDLFKYAKVRELLATLVGITFMVYAASWQPISVFILAIMASLMGQYSKQTSWLKQLNGTSSGITSNSSSSSSTTTSTTTTTLSTQTMTTLHRVALASANHHRHYHVNLINDHNDSAAAATATTNTSYEGYSFLGSLYSFVTPLFDLGLGASGGAATTTAADQRRVEENEIWSATREILERESQQFLRKSFEINGSAFVLALTQLSAFFLGMTLITWAARKQASRIKLLYFHSCLHQEVTWFEAIDSASGSGSSLNGLVDKYEDGIGMKLALLCYFLGHVGLFALTAFYQMPSLAAFCMPFVLAIGLVIAYLSDLQAAAIGQHALFAKRALQLAEEIIAAIRTVFAFNGQQKEIARYSMSLEPVYRKSLVKHLYTALNTALSKFSIFACFAIYCFYAKHLFPPYSNHANLTNKSTILAVMRGAEVSIVNILISIPFLEALQQSKGSIARIFVAIERRSKISAASERGLKPTSGSWAPSISFRMVQFGYADRSGPTQRRRSTLPFLNLTTGNQLQQQQQQQQVAGTGGGGTLPAPGANGNRRRSVIEQIADEAIDSTKANNESVTHAEPTTRQRRLSQVAGAGTGAGNQQQHHHQGGQPTQQRRQSIQARRQSAVIRHMLGNEIRERKLGGAGASQRVLRDFNLDIAAGQSVALVGPSGSGKSTLLALVQRLYDITSGQLLVGRHDIKDLNLAWLRQQIGLVGQEPRLFDMSIAENIALGLGQEQFELLVSGGGGGGDNDDDDSPGTASGELVQDEKQERLMQQVVGAARAANAHEFISRLPRGYATRVGSGGFQLSGGQKQRIAIARALIRKPKILLLDECTSALDTESESLVHAALNSSSSSSMGGDGNDGQAKLTTNVAAAADGPKDLRTTLIVAHRLDTIRHVDLIVVMNQGQVVACGTHEELMRTAAMAATGDGHGARIYRQLYEEQLQARQQQQQQRRQHGTSGGAGGCNSAGGGGGSDGAILEEGEGETDDDCDNSAAARGHLGGASGGELNNQDLARSPSKPEPLFKLNEPAEERAHGDEFEEDEDDDDNDDDQDMESTTNTSTSSSLIVKPGAWKLWRFIEMPKWSALAAMLVCFLAGLILPLNLIAHSYLFSAFAYNELEQIGEYLHVFGLIILSFSTFVLIVSFLQVILPGYVGEKLSARLRVKTIDALLQKPMFYFDMDSNSAGALCDRFNGYISNLQSIAGTRVATMLEACSTLAAGAIFGFGQNLPLSSFCLSFALLVLVTTIIESRIVERESSLQQRYDGQLAHLMADALSNIKTIASLNREQYFIDKFKSILRQRERGIGRPLVCLHTFLTSLKFVMPAMSWSASMYYGSCLLTSDRIDLQTIYIVCPVVLFAVNDTFRALVFLPELLMARKSIERLFKLNRDFSPEVLQTLTFGQQLAEQSRLHLEQLVAETSEPSQPFGGAGGPRGSLAVPSQAGGGGGGGGGGAIIRRPSNLLSVGEVDEDGGDPRPQRQQLDANLLLAGGQLQTDGPAHLNKKKKSISFALEPVDPEQPVLGEPGSGSSSSEQFNRRLSNVQNLPSYMRRKSSRLNSLVPRTNARGRIEFKRVEFAYPNRPTALVLDNFTLSIAPGESVALVGASGSGKSTTVAILEKFYDYHGGDVTLDGRDLRLVEPTWVRSQIGLVQQEPCLLSYTIGDNIRYGDNSRFVTMDEVVEAARTANIHDFIMTLPDQYDTELSSSAYSSCQLSGGQRQRIAIARALVRNAPILIFDEATSALDNKSEQVVQDALRKAKRGRTNLTIAHRLATIKDADKIVVMRDGRVVEQGRHEELLARPNGCYRALWAKQGAGGGYGSNSDAQ